MKAREFWIEIGEQSQVVWYCKPPSNLSLIHVIEYSAVLEAVLKEQEVSKVISTALKDTTKALVDLRKERDKALEERDELSDESKKWASQLAEMENYNFCNHAWAQTLEKERDEYRAALEKAQAALDLINATDGPSDKEAINAHIRISGINYADINEVLAKYPKESK